MLYSAGSVVIVFSTRSAPVAVRYTSSDFGGYYCYYYYYYFVHEYVVCQLNILLKMIGILNLIK